VSADQLAYHWFSAGDMPRAAVHAREAARRARAALNFDRAAELGRMLLDTGCFAEGDRAALRVECAEALALAGRPREAAAMFILAVEHEAPERRFEGQRRAAEQLLRGGYIEEGLATISEVLREFDIALARTAWLAVAFMLCRSRGSASGAHAGRRVTWPGSGRTT
jgi:hypothetical protein